MTRTSFRYVAEMNEAFGNPKGNPHTFDPDRILAQMKNIEDEYFREFIPAVSALKLFLSGGATTNAAGVPFVYSDLVEEIRDALCDIQVFTMGAQHLIGVDGDADMEAVLDGVMTRFCKTQEELDATIAKFAAKGVTEVYTEGEFPKMVLKSAADQPDAPKGKFLKSVGYTDTKFAQLQLL